ncbi:signal peptidase I [Clostridium sp.]|uniref:signal peptidase I n=1 Tax=Clostridium sp. TaxID=1506 RepID=UPI001A52979D|nr:signal peptidase I [Clostridium sp.]MBK5240639.1 signal peptidase I [Clostridium sp.]
MIDTQKLKPTRISKARCILLIIIMLSIYLIENIQLFSFNKGSIYIYIVKPLIWAAVILLIYFFPRMKSTGKIRLNSYLQWWVVYLAIIYILLMLSGGLIYGFGKSPYDLSLGGVFRNIFFVFLPLVGKESIRAYLINSIKGKKIAITITILAVLYTLLNVPLNRLMDLKSGLEVLQYLGEYILPELSKNIIAGSLVFLGGPYLSIIYLGIIQAFNWLSPILPDLNWIAKALIGTLCPIFSLMFLEYLYSSKVKTRKKAYVKEENPIGWIATISSSLLFVWFVVGVFPVYPSVIVTGSMMPMINPGDVVLVKKIEGQNAKLEDIIQFKSDDIFIFHRVINISDEENQLKFETKGDNNSVADRELVDPGLVKGRVIKVIPKIGWPSLWLKDRNNISKDRVEF